MRIKTWYGYALIYKIPLDVLKDNSFKRSQRSSIKSSNRLSLTIIYDELS